MVKPGNEVLMGAVEPAADDAAITGTEEVVMAAAVDDDVAGLELDVTLAVVDEAATAAPPFPPE
jgi:hypothetical protein